MLIKIEDFIAFLESSVREGKGLFQEIILPRRAGDKDGSPVIMARLDGSQNVSLEGYRAVDPLKILFYNVREQVFPVTAEPIERLIVGVKACDLKALKILDKALINDTFVDPAYKIWRQGTSLVTVDCTEVGPACHCTEVGGKPFSEEGFDLNLTRIDDKYEIVEGSEKGKKLLNLISSKFPASETDIKTQETVSALRAEMTEKVKSQNASLARSSEYGTLRDAESSPWQEESSTCVGCGACTNICPTCYCLILNDEGEKEDFIKVRSYDSCQLHGYARVAGGASPRPRMHQRFRNRYLCKFLYMPDNFDELGCTGCGRCTDACPGEIDFRSVVHGIMKRGTAGSGKGRNSSASEQRGG